MNISVYMHIHINVQSSRHNNKSLCLIKIVVLSTVEGNNIQGNWAVPFSVPKVSFSSLGCELLNASIIWDFLFSLNIPKCTNVL